MIKWLIPKTKRIVARLTIKDKEAFTNKLQKSSFSEQLVIEKLVMRWVKGEIKI